MFLRGVDTPTHTMIFTLSNPLAKHHHAPDVTTLHDNKVINEIPLPDLVVKVLDWGSRVQNHWVALRSTQPFILPRSIK